MLIVRCNFNGQIPFLGRGPVARRKLEESKYASLKAMGYPVEIIPLDAPVSPIAVETVAEEVVVQPVETAENSAPVETEQPVTDVPVENAQTEAPAEETSDVKALTEEELNELSEDDLKSMLPADVKLPPKAGKKWIIKQLLGK